MHLFFPSSKNLCERVNDRYIWEIVSGLLGALLLKINATPYSEIVEISPPSVQLNILPGLHPLEEFVCMSWLHPLRRKSSVMSSTHHHLVAL